MKPLKPGTAVQGSCPAAQFARWIMMPRRRMLMLIMIVTAMAAGSGTAYAASLGGNNLQWPTWDELWRVLTLRDYNTRVVVIGTTLLGFAAGLTGTFLLLRKRALLSDALSHATLPGIVLAFMLMSAWFGQGKHLIGLIAGAAVFAVLGTLSVLLIQRYSRLKDDAALGIVLSVYFGWGVALMGLATRLDTGDSSGLSSFIYGKTASMLYSDALLIAFTALAVAALCLLLFKEFALVCFDAAFAAVQGWPVGRLDLLMMSLVVVVTVVGLQAVGLILVVALLIIPPSSARFWSYRLSTTLWLAGGFGALSGLLGSALSALMANLPAGAVIVLTAASLFLVSLTFGSARGLLRIGSERIRLNRKIGSENLLRELYECLETRDGSTVTGSQGAADAMLPPVALTDIQARRSWSLSQLRRIARRLARGSLLRLEAGDRLRLSALGLDKAREVVRRHRLWEAYLITHADIAPGQVDFAADRIEHVLDPDMISRLEALLPTLTADPLPRSPHRLTHSKGVG